MVTISCLLWPEGAPSVLHLACWLACNSHNNAWDGAEAHGTDEETEARREKVTSSRLVGGVEPGTPAFSWGLLGSTVFLKAAAEPLTVWACLKRRGHRSAVCISRQVARRPGHLPLMTAHFLPRFPPHSLAGSGFASCSSVSSCCPTAVPPGEALGRGPWCARGPGACPHAPRSLGVKAPNGCTASCSLAPASSATPGLGTSSRHGTKRGRPWRRAGLHS